MEVFGLTASEPEIFSISGPICLGTTTLDWKNPDLRRSVAASLVQGVYSQELDRKKNREGPQALAPPWWASFHFQLMKRLYDDADGSIFGAIYEFNPPPSPYCYNQLGQNHPPRYVVAFRGTMLKPNTWLQDVKLNIKLFQNKLERRTRVSQAKRAVEDRVAGAGAANVWIAGHSLGSSIALLAGKHMAKQGCFVETYLFNPPFLSVPIEKIENNILNHAIRCGKSLITAGIVVATNDRHRRLQKNKSFVELSGWIPNLFVNQSDPICFEYIGYFEHRLKMIEAAGLGRIERIAAQYSIRNELSVALGRDSKPSHLLPSAYMTIHQSSSEGFRQAHGINQWWKPSIPCHSKLYEFK